MGKNSHLLGHRASPVDTDQAPSSLKSAGLKMDRKEAIPMIMVSWFEHMYDS